MIFYEVLCLKSILGFLFSKRMSGVAPVIFEIGQKAVFSLLIFVDNNFACIMFGQISCLQTFCYQFFLQGGCRRQMDKISPFLVSQDALEVMFVTD